MPAINNFELVVGLEVHIQLNTKTKLFSSDSTLFGEEANTQTNEVSLAHPGSLPVLNKEVVVKAIKMGIACNSKIERNFYFDRKHYFYPDSPLGYQITQQNKPICVGGFVSIPSEGQEKQIPLEKIHMEADAGKSIHDMHASMSFVDLNRAGMPLLELVTKPAFFNIEDVGTFVQEIQRIVRFTDIGDGNMEAGSLRCDANISIRPIGSDILGQKVEIKNMNSVRHIKKALEYEFKRQSEILNSDGIIVQESRLFNVERGVTEGMREKEEAHDYRYFPDPDIAPVLISEKQFKEVEEMMPTLPAQYRRKFEEDFELSSDDALILSDNPLIAQLLVETIAHSINPADAAKWIIGPYKGLYNQQEGKEIEISGTQLAELISLVNDGNVTYRNGVDSVLPEMIKTGKRAEKIIVDLGLGGQSEESELYSVIQSVMDNNPQEVKAYQNGKKALLQLFMGKIMKETRGKADPKTTMKLIKEIIG